MSESTLDVAPYDARAVTVLRGLEAVRRRPAMYVGSTGPEGLLHLAAEVIQNAVDEALAGHGRRVVVTLHDDGRVEVGDEGRGIPVDPHPDTGRPAAELVLTTLHAGGKFDEGPYLAPGGMHGVGVSCVNALSSELELEVRRDGSLFRQRYRQGVPVADLERVGEAEGTGTRICYRPDEEVFGAAVLPVDTLDDYLRAQAFLCAGLRIRLDDRRGGRLLEHQYDTGLVGFVEELDQGRAPVHGGPVRLRGAHAGAEVDVALHWTWAFHEEIRGYVNHVPTPRGGTHVEGLKAALTRVIDAVAREGGLLGAGESIAGWDVREGLTAALSLRLRDAAFEGQTKSALSTPGAAEAVERVVAEGL
ncbi:MAG: hypothetical protein FJ090_16640, partial [Deltaproteobacteria bacterium]|nr:hypothetical protein [Deltaproteobacteria bacterium]